MKISAKNVSFSYSEKQIFSGFNLEIDSDAGPVCIFGHSGSGKTTLLKLLSGLLKPDSGEVITAPRASFMFQEARLLPWLTVLENVRLPLEKDFGKNKAVERAKEFLSLVGLEKKTASYPQEISGGEAQRASMARAFAWQADALFMDEPFQSLDIPLRKDLMDLTLSLFNNSAEKEKRLLVMVSHDPYEAEYLGAKVIDISKPCFLLA